MSLINELYTRIRNISGETKNLTFLGYTVTLEDDEIHNYRGDLIINLGYEAHVGRRAAFDKLAALLEAGDIEILSRPMPIFYDAERDAARGLGIEDGLLGLVTPSYASDVDSSFTEVDT